MKWDSVAKKWYQQREGGGGGGKAKIPGGLEMTIWLLKIFYFMPYFIDFVADVSLGVKESIIVW